MRLVVYSYLPWYTKVFVIALLSQEERLILDSALAKQTDASLVLNLNENMLSQGRPKGWRHWLQRSLKLTSGVKFLFTP